MSREKNREYQKDMPYTVVAHTSIPTPRMSITLTAEGIKELAKRTKKGDLIVFTEWADYTDECGEERHYRKIEIIK